LIKKEAETWRDKCERSERRFFTNSESVVVSWPWSSVWTHISAVSIPLIETRKQKKIAFYS
jgi:hypothetical protein